VRLIVVRHSPPPSSTWPAPRVRRDARARPPPRGRGRDQGAELRDHGAYVRHVLQHLAADHHLELQPLVEQRRRGRRAVCERRCSAHLADETPRQRVRLSNLNLRAAPRQAPCTGCPHLKSTLALGQWRNIFV